MELTLHWDSWLVFQSEVKITIPSFPNNLWPIKKVFPSAVGEIFFKNPERTIPNVQVVSFVLTHIS